MRSAAVDSAWSNLRGWCFFPTSMILFGIFFEKNISPRKKGFNSSYSHISCTIFCKLQSYPLWFFILVIMTLNSDSVWCGQRYQHFSVYAYCANYSHWKGGNTDLKRLCFFINKQICKLHGDEWRCKRTQCCYM